MRSVRVSFLGNDAWSVPSLEALASSSHQVVLVVTAEPKPAGRGNELRPTAVAEAARAMELPLAEVDTVKAGSGFKALAASQPDVLVVVAYGEILPPNVLNLPAIAPVNVHFSLLPQLRGASPVQTAILMGLGKTGVSTIVMDRGLDTGPVMMQREEPVREDDDAGSLGARLADIGALMLVETIDRLASGPVAPSPQDHTIATFAPKFGPQDRRIDWTAPADVLSRLVRALSPEPSATASFRGEGLKVFRAEAVEAEGVPGVVVEVTKRGFVVATGRGGLRPIEIGPAGRKRMGAAEFVRGYHPVSGEAME